MCSAALDVSTQSPVTARRGRIRDDRSGPQGVVVVLLGWVCSGEGWGLRPLLAWWECRRDHLFHVCLVNGCCRHGQSSVDSSHTGSYNCCGGWRARAGMRPRADGAWRV